MLLQCVNLLNSHYARDNSVMKYLANVNIIMPSLVFPTDSFLGDILYFLQTRHSSYLELEPAENSFFTTKTVDLLLHLLDSVSRVTEAQTFIVIQNLLGAFVTELMQQTEPVPIELLLRIITRILTNPDTIYTMVSNLGYSTVYERLLDSKGRGENYLKAFSQAFVAHRLEIVPVLLSLFNYAPTSDVEPANNNVTHFQEDRVAIALCYVMGPYIPYVMLDGMVETSKFGSWAPSSTHAARIWKILFRLVYETPEHNLSENAVAVLIYMEKFVPRARREFKRLRVDERETKVASLAHDVELSGASFDNTLTLTFPNDEGASLLIDATLASQASVVIKSMVSGNFAESLSRQLILSNEDKNSWVLFSRYLVTIPKQLKIKDLSQQFDNAFQLVKLAEKYLIDALAEDCLLFLTSVCKHAAQCEDWELAIRVYRWSHFDFQAMYLYDKVKDFQITALQTAILCLTMRSP
jgi:hypothetical protein